MSQLRFDNLVAIVTGSGGGLGRTYALLLASRGAKVVVNDLGGHISGEGSNSRPADLVVQEIRNAGGIAVADYNSVEDGDKIAKTALNNFGRIDILVNNAGILRDRSFARTSDTDWDLVHNVHLRGSFMVTRAVWPTMKQQNFGRIIMTSSTSGIYGNFGQANYSAAKLGLVGFCNTLAIEGKKYEIHCNTVAPIGGTRLTEGILPPELFDELKPELVAPIVAWLCHSDCAETGGLFEAGAGWYGKYRWERSKGALCRSKLEQAVTPEDVRNNWDSITSFDDSLHLQSNAEAAGMFSQMLEGLRETEQKLTNKSNNPETTEGPLSAIGTEHTLTFSYEAKDIILYALGVGASVKDENGLKLLYEGSDEFCALPTFVIVPLQSGLFGSDPLFQKITGWTVDLTKVLHGEQYIELLQPLPACADVTISLTISDVLDKGSGAVILVNGDLHDDAGNHIAKSQWSVFVVGEGNFGGPRNSPNVIPLEKPPKRKPDIVETFKTSVDQAALYRLSGDRNPLHIDHDFAALGGFSEPILHGLCSYGIAARLILQVFCKNDVSKFKAIKTRFAKPVIPGQSLMVSMWQEGSRIYFEGTVKETGKLCLSGGYVDLYGQPEVTFPSTKEKLHTVDTIFQTMSQIMDKEVADKIDSVFQWNILADGEIGSQWTFDFVGPSSIYKGLQRHGIKPEATIVLSVDDFIALTENKLDTKKAIMSKQIKVFGMLVSFAKLMSPVMPRAKL